MKRVAALLIVAACVYSAGITMPFTRHQESNLTLFGKHGRNFRKFGGITPREVSGPRLDAYDDARKYHYIEHPFMSAWLVGLSYAVFGVHEWSTRLPFVLFALAGVVAFWRVALRVVGERPAMWAAGFFALSPMYAYFSVAAAHPTSTIVFLLLGILFYLRWIESGSRRDLALMFGMQVLGCFSDWPGYYLALFLLAHTMLVRRASWKVATASVGFNFLIFGGYVAWVASVGCLDRLLFAGTTRSSSAPIGSYIVGEAREMVLYFTVALLLLAIVWIVMRGRTDRAIWCFLILGVDEIAFRNLAAGHDFYTFYFGIFLSLAGGRAVIDLTSRIPRVWAARACAVAIALLFAAQAGWVLRKRLTSEGGYLFYRDLGLALEEGAPPDARILILVDDITHYTPYYGDRFALRYHAEAKLLRYENVGFQVPVDNLARYVEEHGSEFDVVVMARADHATAGNEFFRRNGITDPQILAKFHVLPPGSELERVLERRAKRMVVRRGFSFYFLR